MVGFRLPLQITRPVSDRAHRRAFHAIFASWLAGIGLAPTDSAGTDCLVCELNSGMAADVQPDSDG